MTAVYILITVIALILILCAVLFFTKLTLIITIDKKGLGVKIKKFNFGFTFGLNKKKEDKVVREIEKKVDNEDKIMKKFFDIRNTFMRQKNAISASLSYMRGKIDLNEIALYGYFGTGNPMTGGIAYGTVYAFFNTVTAFLANYFVIKSQPHLNLKLKEHQCICDLIGAFMIKAKPYDVLKAIVIYKKTLKKGN